MLHTSIPKSDCFPIRFLRRVYSRGLETPPSRSPASSSLLRLEDLDAFCRALATDAAHAALSAGAMELSHSSGFEFTILASTLLCS